MKNLQKRLASCLLTALTLCACNGDDKDNGDAVNTAGSASLLPSTPIPGARGPNAPPTLGPRIDRAGRPAITAALIATFEADPDTKRRVVADYNAAGLSNQQFTDTIKASLGVLDGLDGKCGNQLLADPDPAADRYAPLAKVLLDDQLYLNSDRDGSVYLGVEAEFVKAAPAGGGAAGGREPGDDVIERSYSVLAAGAFSGIDDNVPIDDPRPNPDVFPFLAAPR
jgi:hypothetical protein